MLESHYQFKMTLILFILMIIQYLHVHGANILGIIPTASYSHQVPFHPLWRELSLRGHSVTVITTHPIGDPSLVNLTEIDISYTREIYKKYKFIKVASDEGKGFLEIADTMMSMLGEADEAQLSSPEIQNLIHNKSIHFDLVIVEAQLPGMMAFSWRFDAPMIGIASLESGRQYHSFLGNPSHPVINPDANLPVNNPENLTFKERVSSLIYNLIYEYVFLHRKVLPQSYERFKRFFGEDLPYFTDLHQNMAMLFTNTNPIFQNVRALNPNTVAIGGTLHIKDPQPLPKVSQCIKLHFTRPEEICQMISNNPDLQEYLDNSKEGAIYFSLGSNIPGYRISDILKQVLPAFSELPYKFLVKTDLELEDIPDNVRIMDWFPQQDLLRHPNLKLFITQGGLQSLQEAVFNGLPLIGIPFFGDQFANVNKMVVKGYGIKLENSKITKESIKDAISEVISNPKYRETAKELSEILKDEEMSGLQKAVWWTEYVIRHKGANHLKSPAIMMPLWKFYMLDIIGLIGFSLCIFIFIVVKLLKCIICKISKSSSKPKIKSE